MGFKCFQGQDPQMQAVMEAVVLLADIALLVASLDWKCLADVCTWPESRTLVRQGCPHLQKVGATAVSAGYAGGARVQQMRVRQA